MVLPPEHARIALRYVGHVMAPGGRIFIIVRMLDDTRLTLLATMGFNLTFLNIYDDVQAYTEGEHRTWLAELGFVDITIEISLRPGRASLISVGKPTD